MRMTTRTIRSTAHGFRGFTLIELLVVIGVMVILFTIALPSVRSLTGSGSLEAAQNTVSSAVASARSFAAIDPPFGSKTPAPSDNDEYYTERTYVGAGVLFTPSGEVRFIRNVDQNADGTKLKNGSGATLNPKHNAFADLNVPYLNLPRGVGAVGLLRNTGGLSMIAPPFAFRFNKSGELIVRNPYDAVTNGAHLAYDCDLTVTTSIRFDTSKDRQTSYAPEEYDPESSNWVAANRVLVGSEYKLRVSDFDALESVVGIILYNKNDFWDQGYELDGEYNTTAATFSSDAEAQWIVNNGTMMMFNRYTGSVVPKP